MQPSYDGEKPLMSQYS